MSARGTGRKVALVGPVVLLIAVGLTIAVLTRYGPLTQPWGYVALACAGVGIVAATLLGVMRAHAAAEE